MKKKILLLVLLLIPVLLITGCGKEEKEKISITDPAFGYETSFSYGKEEKFSNVKTEEGGASTEVTFENKDLDVEFQMYYTKMMKSSYDRSQEVRKNQKYYKEYKFGDYKAYAYGEYTSGIYLNILLDVDSTDTAKALFVAIDRMDTNEEVVVSKVLDKELKEFFNSIEVNSVDQ